MNYSLPDGITVDLSKVFEVSEIRDYGYDVSTVDLSILRFSIRLKSGASIPVTKYYHYEDWNIRIIELRKIRADFVAQWEEYKVNIKNT
jgi:hypothetical protein